MDKNGIAGAREAAYACFAKTAAAIEENDAAKVAVCFYDIVKRAYSFAREEDLFEADKDSIDESLGNTKKKIEMLLIERDWSMDQIKEFEEEVDKLWIR
jgi:hypothetical protein